MAEAEGGSTVYVSAYGRVERIVLDKVSLVALHESVAKCFDFTGNLRVHVEEDGQELRSDHQVVAAVTQSRSLRVIPGEHALAEMEQKMWHLRQMQLGFFQDELLQLKHAQTSSKDEAQRLRDALERQSQMLGELAKELRTERCAREEAEKRLAKQQDEIREELRGDQRGHETGEATLRKQMQEVRQDVLRLSAASERDVSDLQQALGKEAKTRGKTIEALLSEWAAWASSQQEHKNFWASSQQELQAQLLEVRALAERRIADETADARVNANKKHVEEAVKAAIEKAVREHVHAQLEAGAKAVSQRLNEKLDVAVENLHEEALRIEVRALAERRIADETANARGNANKKHVVEGGVEWETCEAAIEKAVREHVHAQLEAGAKAVSQRLNEKLDVAVENLHEEVRMAATDAAEAVCRAEEAAIDAAAARRGVDCLKSGDDFDDWRAQQFSGQLSLLPPQAPSVQSDVCRSPAVQLVANSPPFGPGHARSPSQGHARSPSPPPRCSPPAPPSTPIQHVNYAHQCGPLLAPALSTQLPRRKSLDPRLLPSQQGLAVASNGGA